MRIVFLFSCVLFCSLFYNVVKATSPSQKEVDSLDLTSLPSQGKLEEKKQETTDDLENLKQDVSPPVVNASSLSSSSSSGPAAAVLSLGEEESKLLSLVKKLERKITTEEWNDLSTRAKALEYEILEGDSLWTISKRLFGSGFYYSKIWSLNPYIKNPHFVYPKMSLSFDTGTSLRAPIIGVKGASSYSNIWQDERKKMVQQGILKDQSSVVYDHLMLKQYKNNQEYEEYVPPLDPSLNARLLEDYDDTGFDRNSKIVFNVKQGFFLNTFITKEILRDFGSVTSSAQLGGKLKQFDQVYITFKDPGAVKEGDIFSIYKEEGKVSHRFSEREGHRYTVMANLETVRREGPYWICRLIDVSGEVERGSKITSYIPKISQLLKTYSSQKMEAIIFSSTKESLQGVSLGDIVYFDRGRSDGLSMGNVFNLFSVTDPHTEEALGKSVRFKAGEAMIISLTEHFSTAVITNSILPLPIGTLAVSQSFEEAQSRKKRKKVISIEKQSLGFQKNVDIPLSNLPGENLLTNPPPSDLTDSEMFELQRQKQEKDSTYLDQLEKEIEEVSKKLDSAKTQQDKKLETKDLNKVEENQKKEKEDFGPINDIEKQVGKKYLEENLNVKPNPYGLSKDDVEEIDALLNNPPR